MRALDYDRRLAGFALLGMLALLLVAGFVTPGTMPWLPPCPFYQLTGLYCPGCGATRMLYLLVHGHPVLAIHENAVALLALPFVMIGLLCHWMGRRRLILPHFASRLRPAFAVVVILFTIARNLPLEPFQRLAPLQIAQNPQ